MTHKKLQKLCYYAVAWNYGINKDQLCKRDHFEAWIHGPVNKILYNKYKSYGWHPIPKSFPILLNDKYKIELLEVVWNTYKSLNGHQLEMETHQDQPFIDARCGLDTFDPCTNIIKKEDMIQYYGELYEKTQGD